MSGKYHFSDGNESRMTGEMRRESGCFVRVATGFVLAFLAIAIAVGVGIIVHFAENRKLECTYPVGTGNTAPSQMGSQQGQCPNASLSKQCPVCNTQPTAMVGQTTMKPSMTSQTPPKPDVRLPRDFIPTGYELRIQPDMYGDDPKAFTFTGRVKIKMDCSSAVDKVVLHAKQINVRSVTFNQESGTGVSPKFVSYEEDKGRQFLMVHLDRVTSPGHTYSLTIDYTGPLTDDLQGFYLTTYEQNGQTIYAGVTQFEPTDARKAFPCFDEPAMKATFQVTLVRKRHQMTLSNMPVTNKREIDHDFVEDVYATSVKMSTYLLAFVIGQFENTTKLTANNVTYGAWSRPQFQGQVTLALDVGTKILTFYESYFGIKFPLPKQDMIALPDFRAGAMENWGLITYREAAMLYDEQQSSVVAEQRVVVTITHEVAHQIINHYLSLRREIPDKWYIHRVDSFSSMERVRDFVASNMNGSVMILFPLHTENHWSLLVLKTKEIAIHILDPVSSAKVEAKVKQFLSLFKSADPLWKLANKQLKDFQKAHPDMGSGTRAFAQAIEGTQSNIRWMKDNYAILEKWLNAKRGN